MTLRRTTRRRPEEQEGLQEVEDRERIADFSSLIGTVAKMETLRSKEQIEEWRLESSGVVDD
uniref:Uncharacterized protein n=1 Tax=Oryza sativa subsp. japonica TaxID=39947 RepID=Q6ZHQ0_ORYSJ|nr:hypothetical protein [Oryza sativa Japonica Group]